MALCVCVCVCECVVFCSLGIWLFVNVQCLFFFNHFWSPYLNFLCFCKRHSVLILVFLSAGSDDDDDDDESEKEEKKWEEQQIQKAVKHVFSYNYYNGQTSFISLLVKVIVPSMKKKMSTRT